MKRIHISILSLVLPMLAACNGNKPEPVPGPVRPQKETRTLTFVLPSYEGVDASSAMKNAWLPGDQIVVHGEYSRDQVLVTLEAADISSDGKSATKTVEGLLPYKREDCGSTLYASYPADVVDNLKHCFFYSKFSTTNSQLLAAFNESDTFRFCDVCGAISFTVDDSFDSYSISGTRKEALGYEFLQVKLTDAESNYRQYVGDPVLSLSGELTPGANIICLPDGSSLSGCTIKFARDGQFTGIYKYSEGIQVNRGDVVNLGNIAENIEPYDDPFSKDILDLDENGNANCYIIDAPGKYKFKAVRGNNSVAFLEDVADACVLWETYNNAEVPESHSVVAEVSYAEDYIILHTPDVLQAGNAVIAARDFDNNILWSWHIWVPQTTIQTESFGMLFNTDVMDRNLGALVVAEADASPVVPEAFGLMYQWGRKDPYPAGNAVSSSTPAATVGEVEFVKAPSQISLEESIANPTLLGHMDNGDWLKPSDGTLWANDIKTIYDPCPPGYRVPASDSNGFWGDLSKVAGWGFDKTNAWFKAGNPATVFPLAGYRDDYSVDSIAHAYDRGLVWSASAGSAEKPGYGRGEDVRPGSSISFKETPKSRAGSVRCVKE